MIAPILELVRTCQGKLFDILHAATNGNMGDVEIELTNTAGPNIVLTLQTKFQEQKKVTKKKTTKKAKKKAVRKKTNLRKK